MLNELTKRLYSEGWTHDKHPDHVYCGDFENLCYKWDTLLGMNWKTPCGLFADPRSIGISDTSYNGVWYCPENNNPLVLCPYGKNDCKYVPEGMKFPWCPCRLTEEKFDRENSIEKIEEEINRTAHKQYMEITDGSYCACVVHSNDYSEGFFEVKYDVEQCIRAGCQNAFCIIRKQKRDLSKCNIFYDIRREWTVRQGLIEDHKTSLTKGIKVFDRQVARTDAEIWLKAKKASYDPIREKHIISPKLTSEDRSQEFFSKQHRQYGQYEYFEFSYKVENIRIENKNTRDLLQDLRDIAEGIEVVHQVDIDKAKKQEKKDSKLKRAEQKERKMQKWFAAMILDLERDDQEVTALKRAARSVLGSEETERLCKERENLKNGIGKQISFLDLEDI